MGSTQTKLGARLSQEEKVTDRQFCHVVLLTEGRGEAKRKSYLESQDLYFVSQDFSMFQC